MDTALARRLDVLIVLVALLLGAVVTEAYWDDGVVALAGTLALGGVVALVAIERAR